MLSPYSPEADFSFPTSAAIFFDNSKFLIALDHQGRGLCPGSWTEPWETPFLVAVFLAVVLGDEIWPKSPSSHHISHFLMGTKAVEDKNLPQRERDVSCGLGYKTKAEKLRS